MTLTKDPKGSRSLLMKTGATTANKNELVALNVAAEGQCDNTTQYDTDIAGVVTTTTMAAGTESAIQYLGVAHIKIASAIAIGEDVVCADTSGRIGPFSASVASGATIVGEALSAGDSVNDVIAVRLTLCTHHT